MKLSSALPIYGLRTSRARCRIQINRRVGLLSLRQLRYRALLPAVPAPLASCLGTICMDRLVNGHGPAVCQTG